MLIVAVWTVRLTLRAWASVAFRNPVGLDHRAGHSTPCGFL